MSLTNENLRHAAPAAAGAQQDGFTPINPTKAHKTITLTGEDIREGLTAIISVRLRDPQFEGQTKGKLGNVSVRTLVQQATYEKLNEWLEENPKEANAVATKAMIPESRGGKIISWLPAAHIAERGANYYLPVMKGASITICADPRKIVETLPEVHPTFFFAVPRIWEKVKAHVDAYVARTGEDIEWFWTAALRDMSLLWDAPYHTLLDLSRGPAGGSRSRSRTSRSSRRS